MTHPMLEKVARAMWAWDYQTQMFRDWEPDRWLYIARARAAIQALLLADEFPAEWRAMLLPLVDEPQPTPGVYGPGQGEEA